MNHNGIFASYTTLIEFVLTGFLDKFDGQIRPYSLQCEVILLLHSPPHIRLLTPPLPVRKLYFTLTATLEDIYICRLYIRRELQFSPYF